MKKNTLAVCRAAAALVAALILLSVTGFAFVDMLKGPVQVTNSNELNRGDYVEAQLAFVMDIVGVEKNAAGKDVAYYGVSPMGDTFTMIRFPVADFENIAAMEEATRSFLQGETVTMDFYMTVIGTVAPMDETLGGLLIEWFEENADWMIASGVIAETEDYSAYLGPQMIASGRVGAMNRGMALAMTILAALLVVYAIVEVLLVAMGVHERKAAPKANGEKPAPSAAPASAAAEPAAVEVPTEAMSSEEETELAEEEPADAAEETDDA